MQGPIRRLARDRLERRDDARLPSAWVGGEQARAAVADLSWLVPDTGTAADCAESGSPVLFMLGEDGEAVSEEMVAHASAGKRVYLLVPPEWGQDRVDPEVLEAPKVLIRRMPEVPVSGVYSGGNASLWIGGDWKLRLDPAQADSFWQVFLRLFWYEATEEAWSGGSQLSWRPAGERPFDVNNLPRTAPVRLVGADARLEADAQGALVLLNSGAPPDAAPRRLWFPAGPDHHDLLSRLVRNGTEVVWEDRCLPDLVLGSDGGEILLPGTRARLRILLTSEQASDAARILEAPARWRFSVDLRLGDPAHTGSTLWLPGEAAARHIETEQVIEVDDVTASTLSAVSDASPATLPEPQPLALSVRYRWIVLPPRLPANTEEDALVDRWHKLDRNWSSRLGKVRDALQAAEDNRGRIGRAFSKLAGAILGFERTHNGLLEKVASMEDQLPSAAGSSGARLMLARLAEIEEQTRKLQSDLEEEERIARETEERDKQEVAWRSRVDDARGVLAKHRRALDDAERRRTVVADELATIKESQKSADKKAMKDLIARQRKLSDDSARTDKEIKRLGSRISDLEQRASEQFEFRSPASPATRPSPTGGRFVPPAANASPASVVPDEDLPTAGILRRHKNQRYLAIQTWEDLAAGEQDADRLSAKLVAQENE